METGTDTDSGFTLSWKATARCNSKCSTCNYWRTADTSRELNLSEACELLDDAEDAGVDAIRFTGGEPTQRYHLPFLAGYAQGRMMTTVVNTNLISLDNLPLNPPICFIDTLLVSFDGFGDTYTQVRGIDASAKVQRNLEYVADHVLNRLVIAVILRDNIVPQIPGLMDMCSNLGAELVFNLPDSDLEFFHQPWALLTDVEAAVDAVLKNWDPSINVGRKEFYRQVPAILDSDVQRCPTVQNAVFVDETGNVMPGCWNAEPVGNVKTEPLKDIVNSSGFEALREQLFRGDCEGCNCGWMRRARHRWLSQV